MAEISIYDTITQADQLLLEVPENNLLQTRYFPTDRKDEFQSKKVLLDFDEGDLKAGAFVQKGYINGETTEWRGSAVEPPRVGIQDTIDPTDADRLLFEQLCYEQGVDNPNRAEAFDDLKRVKALREIARTQRSIEKTCANVFLNNGVEGTIAKSATDSTQVPLNIRYFDPEKGNEQRYIPKYAWGNGSATPYKDVVAMVNALVQHGGKAEDLLIAPEAWQILEADQAFNKQFTTFHTEDSVLFGREVEDARQVGIGNFGGYMLNIIVYYGQYKNDAGNMVQYLPKDFVCVTAPRCGRTLCGGCTLLNPAQIGADDVVGVDSFKQRRGKYVLSQYMDLDAQLLAIRCESRPLPAPYSPWRWVTMEAQNTNDISEGVVAPDVNIDFAFVDGDGEEITPTTKPADIAHAAGGSKLTVTTPVLSSYTFSKFVLEDGSTWSAGLDGKYICPNNSQTITGIMTAD
jgi:hypothetical protein